MKPIFHSFPYRGRGFEAAGLTKASEFVVPKQQKPDTGCIDRVAYHIDESSDILGGSEPDGHVEYFFCEFDRAFHFCTATSQNDSSGDHFLKAAPLELICYEVE